MESDPTRQPSHLQTRTAVETHLSDGRIGREMLAAEEAVRQVKAQQANGTNGGAASSAAAMPPPAPRVTSSRAVHAEEQRVATQYYYKNLFPTKSVHRWASRAWVLDGPEAFKREWGWEGYDGSPFVRWLSCPTAEALGKMVSGPTVGKINMGAMFTSDPGRRYQTTTEMETARREFVIDIDWTDYKGSSTKIAECDRAWPLIAVGLEVVGRVLREAFGFEHLLFVYSGRRGGHIWVCDERASLMNDQERSAVSDFLSAKEKNGELQWRFLIEHPNFSGISKSLMVPFFKQVGIAPESEKGLGLLDIAFQRKQFLESIHPNVVRDIGSVVKLAETPLEALNLIESYCVRSTWIDKDGVNILYSKYEQVIWELLGPRIDANVSKKTNHTLKIPFSVHPKTGRVSVPILGDYLHTFPVKDRAPTVTDLRESADARATLQKAVELFDKFVGIVAASPTEHYRKPKVDYTPPAKRQCVHDMKGSLAETPDRTGDVPVLAPEDRVCWVVHKMITVRQDDEDTSTVRVSQRTNAYGPVAHLIKAGNYPPFPHESHPPSQDKMIEETIAAIKQLGAAADEPVELSAISRPKVIVLRRQCTVEEAERRYAKMADRLKEPDEVCVLNKSWGVDGMSSMLRQKVLPLLEELDEL